MLSTQVPEASSKVESDSEVFAPYCLALIRFGLGGNETSGVGSLVGRGVGDGVGGTGVGCGSISQADVLPRS